VAQSSLQITTTGGGTFVRTGTKSISAQTRHEQYHQLGEPDEASYTVRGASVSTATNDSHLLQIMAGSTLHVYVLWVKVFQQTVATTAALVACDIQQLTTAGTGGGAVTPVRLDGTDSASGATGMTLPSSKGAEGGIFDTSVGFFVQTVSASLGAPQPSLVWEFDWERLRNKAIRIPAGTANGIAVKIRNATAGATVVVMAGIRETNY